MAKKNETPKTIWGSIPAPSANEVENAWGQIIARMSSDSETGIAVAGSRQNRVRFDEFIASSPTLFNHLNLLSRIYADSHGNPELAKAYAAGFADFVEILGTIAMNREIDLIESNLPPNDPNS